MSLTNDQIDTILTNLQANEAWQKLSPEVQQNCLNDWYENQGEHILYQVVSDVQKASKKPKKRAAKPKREEGNEEGGQ